jgi:hypothetical protein
VRAWRHGVFPFVLNGVVGGGTTIDQLWYQARS